MTNSKKIVVTGDVVFKNDIFKGSRTRSDSTKGPATSTRRSRGGATAGTARDHLANERTFLAWVRTALGSKWVARNLERGMFPVAIRGPIVIASGARRT